MHRNLTALLLSLSLGLPLTAGCILRNVINQSESAEISIYGVEPVPGSVALKGPKLGAKVVRRKPNGKPTRVTFNQPTGDRLKIEVQEQSELGQTCKIYELQVNENTHEVNLLKRESCTPHFGADAWTPAEGLPERCYVDLVLEEDVNSLRLDVLSYETIKMENETKQPVKPSHKKKKRKAVAATVHDSK